MAIVPSGFGNSKVATMEARAETRVHSLMPATIDKLKRDGLWDKVQLLMMPDAYSNGKLHALNQAGTADADFTVSRGSAKNTVDNEGYIRKVPANYPSIDYSTGKPVVRTDQQVQNKLLYWKTFENPYYSKSNCDVRLDPSTAGGELVTNGGFDTDTVWNKQTGWSIANGVASCDGTDAAYFAQDFTGNGTYMVTFDISSITSGGVKVRAGTGFSKIFNSIGTHTVYISKNTISFAMYSVAFVGSIDNISVKEVQGYASPFKDDNGSVVLQSRRIYDTVDSSAAYHSIYIYSLPATAGTPISESIIFKPNKGVRLQINADADSTYGCVIYNEITDSFATVGTATSITYNVAHLADGYILLQLTVNNNTSTTGSLTLYLTENGNYNYQGDGTGYVEIAYAQLTEGEAIGVICPYDTAENQLVTRLADDIHNTNIPINPTKWVIFGNVEFEPNTVRATGNYDILLTDGGSNQVHIYRPGSTATSIVALLYDVNGNDASDLPINSKFAIRNNGDGTTSIFVNGILTNTLSVNPINLSEIYLDGRPAWARYSQIGIFDYLTDEQLIDLTK